MADNRQIIHVDMDAFYASVEQLDKPELAGKPVIVGGDPRSRGVVSAASYEARRYGIHSAMPMAQAVRLCPKAIVLPGRMERYVEISQQISVIFEQYTPLVEPVSLDEAFLDVAGSARLSGGAEKIGRAIKREIKQELSLTASVGVAPNKFLAKLASDLEKPDGFVIITDQDKQGILDPLPVGKIWGVGKVMEKALQSQGIYTIAQLRNTPLKSLQAIVGNYASDLLDLASGIDNTEVEPYREAKSMSSELTFPSDVQDPEVLLGVLSGQVEEVAERLRSGGLIAKTLTLKLRYGDFTTITRSRTLDQATNTTRTLWQGAKAVFDQWQASSARPLRLIGFSASGLVAEDRAQLQLFPDPEEQKQRKLDQTVDKIRDRYGNDALKRGHQM